MKAACLLIAILAAMPGCASATSQTVTPSPSFSPSPTLEPTPPTTPSPRPSPSQGSLPESVIVTFELVIDGQPPADAAFALQSGTEGGGGAVYLCSYYGGWPQCDAGAVYREPLEFAPGTVVHYRFWRELDPDSGEEELEQGELVVGATDTVVSVTYEFE